MENYIFQKLKQKQGREFGSPFFPTIRQYEYKHQQLILALLSKTHQFNPTNAGNFFKAENGFKEGLPCSGSCS